MDKHDVYEEIKKYLPCCNLVLVLASITLVPKLWIYHSTHAQTVCYEQPVYHPQSGIQFVADYLIKKFATDNHQPSIVLLTTTGLLRNEGWNFYEKLHDAGITIKAVYSVTMPYDEKHTDAQKIPHSSCGIPLRTISCLSKLKIWRKDKRNIDAIVTDFPTTGFSPYDSSLINKTLDLAQQLKKQLIVCDRINASTKKLATPGSFTLYHKKKSYTIPLRHGLTFGELTSYLMKLQERSYDVNVIPLKGYHRTYRFAESSSMYATSAGLHLLLALITKSQTYKMHYDSKKNCYCIMLPHKQKFLRYGWYELRERLRYYGVVSSLYHYTDPKTRCVYDGLTLAIPDTLTFSLEEALLLLLMHAGHVHRLPKTFTLSAKYISPHVINLNNSLHKPIYTHNSTPYNEQLITYLYGPLLSW